MTLITSLTETKSEDIKKGASEHGLQHIFRCIGTQTLSLAICFGCLNELALGLGNYAAFLPHRLPHKGHNACFKALEGQCQNICVQYVFCDQSF